MWVGFGYTSFSVTSQSYRNLRPMGDVWECSLASGSGGVGACKPSERPTPPPQGLSAKSPSRSTPEAEHVPPPRRVSHGSQVSQVAPVAAAAAAAEAQSRKQFQKPRIVKVRVRLESLPSTAFRLILVFIDSSPP